MVRDLEGEKLDGWLEEAEACKAPALRRFATGLRKDLPAVRAGLTEEWSNGPVERVRPQAEAAEAPGLRTGGLRAAEGEDAGRLKIARTAVQEERTVSPRCRQNPRLLARSAPTSSLPTYTFVCIFISERVGYGATLQPGGRRRWGRARLFAEDVEVSR